MEQKNRLKYFDRKSITVFLQLNLNTRLQNLFDTTVIKVSDQIRYKLYAKPTDKQSYSYSKLEHPLSMKNNIAFSPALVLHRNCYKKSDLERNYQKLLKIPTNKGYDETEAKSSGT